MQELQDFLAGLTRSSTLIAVRDGGAPWANETEMQTRVSHYLRDLERNGAIGAGTTLHGLRVSYAAWWKRSGANNSEVADLLKWTREKRARTRDLRRERPEQGPAIELTRKMSRIPNRLMNASKLADYVGVSRSTMDLQELERVGRVKRRGTTGIEPVPLPCQGYPRFSSRRRYSNSTRRWSIENTVCCSPLPAGNENLDRKALPHNSSRPSSR